MRDLNVDSTANEVNKEKLIADFKVMVADVEELIRATANQTGEALAAARVKAQESLGIAKSKLAAAQATVGNKTSEAAYAADDYVRANPWQAIGIAAAVGVLLGLLMRGGSDDTHDS